MDVGATTNATAAGGGGLGIAPSAESDLQSTFLELMMQQLRNQNPLSPMDNTAFIEQLATFSNLEQLQGVNTRLEQSMELTRSLNNTMMMGLVGKRATVVGNEVQLRDGTPSRTLIRSQVPGLANVHVHDATGQVVRTVSGVRLDGGFTSLEWDGRDDEGNVLPNGTYSLEIEALDTTGSVQPVAVFQSGIVDSIQFDNEFNRLVINGRAYFPSEIVEIGLPDSDRSDGDDDEVGGGDLLTAPWLG